MNKKKTIVAFIVAGIMTLSVPMVALADTYGHSHFDHSADHGELTSDIPGGTYIVGNFECKTTGTIGNDSFNSSAISSGNGATVSAGEAINNCDDSATVSADGPGIDVIVTGNVTNKGKGDGVKAVDRASVTIGGDVNAGHIGIYIDSATVSANDANVSGESNIKEYDMDDYQYYGINAHTEDENSKTTVNNVTVNVKGSTADAVGVAVSTCVDGGQDSGTYNFVEVKGDVNVTSPDAKNVDGVYISSTEGKSALIVRGSIDSDGTGAKFLLGDESTTDIVFVCESTVHGDDNAFHIDVDELNKGKYSINVYELTSGEGNDLIKVDGNATAADIENIYKSINYIIKVAEESKGKFTGFEGGISNEIDLGACKEKYYLANEGTKITVTPESGYSLKAGEIQVTDNGDGTYSVVVPRGGGVTLEAVLKAIQKAATSGSTKTHIPGYAQSSNMTVSSANAITGAWNQSGDTWSFVQNGSKVTGLKDITLPNGGTARFCFDTNGNMLTGWQNIDGTWYYFNAFAGDWQGAMLMNTMTPDGYYVGSNGAWIQ